MPSSVRYALRDAAVTDLDDLAAYIQKDSLTAAIRFLEAAQATIDQLAQMPELGEVFKFQDPRLSGIRVWRVKGFESVLVCYRPLAVGIEIIRVLHGARDIPAVFDEENGGHVG